LPSFETIFIFGVFALVAAAGLAFLVIMRASRSDAAVAAFEAGRFAEAIALAQVGGELGRETLLAGARAARHLLEFDNASSLLDRLLRDDRDDGEIWVEKGLTAAYGRDLDGARKSFQRAAAARSDLLESITLHRAWLELTMGDEQLARRLFDEVEQPITTKLDIDLGDGDPGFAEWFLHAGWLWRGRGKEARATAAIDAARRAAPESQLPDLLDSWAIVA
jgi:tetratricopeptide (TPR) repeat protein